MGLIWSYLSSKPKWLALDILGGLLFVLVNLGLPTILARMIDQGILQQDTKALYGWTLVMFVIIVLGVLGRIILSYASGKLTTTMIKELRNDMYRQLQDYSHTEYEKIGVASLVTRMTSDAFVLMQFAEMSLRLGVVTPLMMIFSVLMIFLTSPSLAWIVAVSMPFWCWLLFMSPSKQGLSLKNNKKV